MADIFRELFGAEQTFLEYENHPSDKVLRYYLKERLPKSIRPPSEVLEGLLRGKLAEWGEFEVAAHVRTCQRCAARLEWLQLPFWERWLQQPSPKRSSKYAEGEVVIGWRLAWVLATAALLVLALGSVSTLYFQVIKLREEITALQLADEQEKVRLQEAINKLGEVVGETKQSTAAAIEELKEIVIASTKSIEAVMVTSPPDSKDVNDKKLKAKESQRPWYAYIVNEDTQRLWLASLVGTVVATAVFMIWMILSG